MKTIIFAAFLISTAASAKEILIYDKEAPFWNDGIRVGFAANESLKRAWVKVSFMDDDMEGGLYVLSTEDVKVPNLIFEAGKIVYQEGKQKTTCAVGEKLYARKFPSFKKYVYRTAYIPTKKYDMSKDEAKDKMESMNRLERRDFKKKLEMNNCSFRTEYKVKERDNGFNIVKEKFTQIFLVIQ